MIKHSSNQQFFIRQIWCGVFVENIIIKARGNAKIRSKWKFRRAVVHWCESSHKFNCIWKWSDRIFAFFIQRHKFSGMNIDNFIIKTNYCIIKFRIKKHYLFIRNYKIRKEIICIQRVEFNILYHRKIGISKLCKITNSKICTDIMNWHTVISQKNMLVINLFIIIMF